MSQSPFVEFGIHLRGLREQVGLTGSEFADALGPGWRQPKVSKIETGRQLPTEGDLAAWAGLTGADASELVAMRNRATADYATYKERITRAGGPVAHQEDITDLDTASTFIGEFQPALIPGNLQTAGYMREKAATNLVLTDNGTSPAEFGQVIAAKIRRQAILHEPGREFVHVVTEAALRLRIGATTGATLRGQLTHLADLAGLPGHTFGVIPFAAQCPVQPSGFALYDRSLVVVETVAGVLQLTDPDAVARYSRWLDQLVDAARTGSAAADFCHQVAASLPD